jgi:DNA-binding transcriptional ArsR family regulator
MPRQPEPGTGDNPLAGIDRLIHEPARMLIMSLLAVVESADFLFLQRQTGLTAGNLSSHLSRLEEAGYVKVEKQFVGKKPNTMLGLTRDGRQAFDRYRDRLSQVLERKTDEQG